MIACALSLVVCSGLSCARANRTSKPAASNAPQPVENTPAPAVKKTVSKAPLPALAADTGGATGKPMWQTGFGGLGIDVPRGVAVGAGNEVYVAGYFDGECDFGGTVGKKPSRRHGSDGFLAKLDRRRQDGLGADSSAAKRDDDANAVAAHGDTVVVVGNFLDEIKAGEFAHKAVGSDDLFAAAYDKDGAVQWLWTLGGIDSDGANAVAAAPDGGWVIGGSYSDSITIGSTHAEVQGQDRRAPVKLAPTGDLEWVKSFGGRYDDTIMHVAVDANGNIYVAGPLRGHVRLGRHAAQGAGGSDNDIVLAKYDANGDHVWSKSFGNVFNDVAGGLVGRSGRQHHDGRLVREQGRDLVRRRATSTRSLGEADAYVARFTTDGKLEWAHDVRRRARRRRVGRRVAMPPATP